MNAGAVGRGLKEMKALSKINENGIRMPFGTIHHV